MDRTPDYPCLCCGGAAHPATGDFDVGRGIQFCHPCVERRKKWHLGQLNRGVAGDGHREEGYESFYEAAETSIKPGMDLGVTRSTKYVRVPNPKAKEKMHKRAGRWRAGPDLVRVPQGPEPWRPFVWRSVPHEFAYCIQAEGDKPCRECTEYALDAVGVPAAARTT